MAKEGPDYDSQLEWIQFREQTLGAENVYPERGSNDRPFQKFQENPLVPIGLRQNASAMSYANSVKGQMIDVNSTCMELLKSANTNGFGCLATATALMYGLWCFRKGKGRQSQIMMRVRIGAQGFTVLALLGGILVSGKSTPKTHP